MDSLPGSSIKWGKLFFKKMEGGGTDSCEVFEKSAEFLDSILVGG